MFGRSDHVAPGCFDGYAGAFLIAAEHDANFRVVERSRLFHGTQRGQHDDQPTLHVSDAGPVATLPSVPRTMAYFWNGLDGSKTVSMCPINSMRLPQRPSP